MATLTKDFDYKKIGSEIVIERYIGTDSIVEVPEEIDNLPVTTIGKGAFEDYVGLKAIYLDGVKVIGAYAFAGCVGLETVVFSNDLKIIHAHAFDDCMNLKHVDLSQCSALKAICDGAFICCKSLERICLPARLELIGNDAFYGCIGLSCACAPKTICASLKEYLPKDCKIN